MDYEALKGTTITVAASPVPHAEILKVAGEILAQADINLKVVEFTDYIQPNKATENGEVDANYFQHGPYLENFNEENGTHLVSVAAIHYEPLGLYPGKTKTLDELADGAQIGVPNDTTNEARALQLLAAQGLITLKDGAGLTATKNDIVDNPKNLNIVEMEAASCPVSWPLWTWPSSTATTPPKPVSTPPMTPLPPRMPTAKPPRPTPTCWW